MGKLRFPSLPVTSHAGTTLNFEKLQKTLPILEALQSKSTTPAYLSWGVVTEAGKVEYGSGDYTVKKESVGVYRIKWAAAKASAFYVVQALLVDESSYFWRCSERETTGFTIRAVTSVEPKAVSAEFSFLVIASS